MEKFPTNWIVVLAICSFIPDVAVSYGHAGLQQAPINNFGTQPIPSVANLPLANNYQVYRGQQNIIRPALVQNSVFPASFRAIQSPYAVQQGQFVHNNYATGIRTASLPNSVWTSNRNPVTSNVPVYHQPSVQPALSSYPAQFQTLQSNAQLLQYSVPGPGVQYNNALLVKPGIQQQLLTPVNQYAAGPYNIQRQPVVKQLGTNVNYLPNQQQLHNQQYSNQLSASPYNVYQTTNPLFLRNNNMLSNNSPSLLQQAQLQQAQLQQLQIQQLQLQQSLLQTQQRLQQQQRPGTLSFRPSPQLPSGTVLDGSSNTVSSFLPLNLNTVADAPTQEWTTLLEDGEVKTTDLAKSTTETTKKPKGKALTLAEPEAKPVPKTSAAKKVSTATPKTKTIEAKKTKTTTTTTKKPAVTPTVEVANAANIVTEAIDSPKATEIDPGILPEATSAEADEPLTSVEAVVEASKNSQLIENKEPDTSDVPSEPLVLAVAEPAFLELIKESS